jgi:hypothetical protein
VRGADAAGLAADRTWSAMFDRAEDDGIVLIEKRRQVSD